MHIEALQDAILELQTEVQQLKEKKIDQTRLPKETEERIAELEVKMAKLWTLLTKIDSRGTERPTNTARKLMTGKPLNK